MKKATRVEGDEGNDVEGEDEVQLNKKRLCPSVGTAAALVLTPMRRRAARCSMKKPACFDVDGRPHYTRVYGGDDASSCCSRDGYAATNTRHLQSVQAVVGSCTAFAAYSNPG